MNVTSGPSYGFTCDFIAGEDDLVLTKLVGGDCICKEQTAFYTIEGTLLCERGEDGTYSLRLVLYYKVPVYDDNITCPTPPCPYEALWETWIWDYTLATGATSSSAICDLGTSPVGPLPFNTDASAQTTCGLGLDGTDATVTVEWKFCDPAPSHSCCGTDACCGWGPDFWPDTITLEISGTADGVPNGPGGAYNCSLCENIDGTYVLERYNNDCTYYLDYGSINACDAGEAADPGLYLLFSPCYDDLCKRYARINLWAGPGNPDQTADFVGSDECPASPSGEVLDFHAYSSWSANYCDFTNATVTIGFP